MAAAQDTVSVLARTPRLTLTRSRPAQALDWRDRAVSRGGVQTLVLPLLILVYRR
jgi:hypothetical protein